MYTDGGDGIRLTHDIHMNATATSPAWTVAPTCIDAGPVICGHAATYLIHLKNSSSLPVRIVAKVTGTGELPEAWHIAGPHEVSLPVRGETDIVVELRTAKMTIDHAMRCDAQLKLKQISPKPETGMLSPE